MSAGHRISITSRITLFTAVTAVLLCGLAATMLMIAIHRYAMGFLKDEIRADGGRVAMQVERGEVDYPLAKRKYPIPANHRPTGPGRRLDPAAAGQAAHGDVHPR